MGNLTSTYSPPMNYKQLRHVESGNYGDIFECFHGRLKRTVAIKRTYERKISENEINIAKKLMGANLHERNIVEIYSCRKKFLGCGKNLMVFEKVDISLGQYLVQRQAPMRLQDVRTVMQQMATALSALKGVRVIHTDVNPFNIMLVDRVLQPFKIKLMEFGSAVDRSRTGQVKIQELASFKAPEVILGLPYSQALDIWSLGIVMASMISGMEPFKGRTDYEQLQDYITLLGQPPARLLKWGRETSKYFKKTASGRWKFKKLAAYESSTRRIKRSPENETDIDEWVECMDLLRKMLKWCDRERITPDDVLKHPFITGIYTSSDSSPSIESGSDQDHQANNCIPDAASGRVRDLDSDQDPETVREEAQDSDDDGVSEVNSDGVIESESEQDLEAADSDTD